MEGRETVAWTAAVSVGWYSVRKMGTAAEVVRGI